MNNNSEINWLNIITNSKFHSNLDSYVLKEISMVSKLARDKLNLVIFKKLRLNLTTIKFNLNVFTIAYHNRITFHCYDYKHLSEENNRSVEDSLNDFIISLNDIKNYCKSFYLEYNYKSAYYLYSLTNLFDGLTSLKIRSCEIPFSAFADIGGKLPNLKEVVLDFVYLVKSDTDITSVSDISFPHNLYYLKLCCVDIVSTDISDPCKFLYKKEIGYYPYECFSLPKASLPSLKRLDYGPKGQQGSELEEFLEINPNVESLHIRKYNLNITSNLNYLKSLDIDENISIGNIDQAFNLSSINNLKFSVTNFSYPENIRKLIQLCPNAVYLNIYFLESYPPFQPIIDDYLAPSLSNLQSLKILVLIDIPVDMKGQILDFTKLRNIERLKIQLVWGSALNIKFDSCKSLKQVEFIAYDDNFTDEFKGNFNRHSNWKFKFSGHTIKGYKI